MMPWMSRLTLEITDVRVQRLQEISEEDAKAEGCGGWMSDLYATAHNLTNNHRTAYMELWDLINAKRGYGWDKNPWVWAITFKRISQ